MKGSGAIAKETVRKRLGIDPSLPVCIVSGESHPPEKHRGIHPVVGFVSQQGFLADHTGAPESR